MRCPTCRGRGWRWVGVADNAEPEVCEPCQGAGVGEMSWLPILMLTCTLAGWAVALGFIWWAVTQIVS